MIGWIKIKSKSSDEHEERGSVDVGLNAHAKSSVLYRRFSFLMIGYQLF